VQAAPDSPIARAFLDLADKVIEVVAKRADEIADDGGGAPVIDRSGGPGGKRRLPVTK
jgi:hypothetical protein